MSLHLDSWTVSLKLPKEKKKGKRKNRRKKKYLIPSPFHDGFNIETWIEIATTNIFWSNKQE